MIMNDNIRYTISNGMSTAAAEYDRIAKQAVDSGIPGMAGQFKSQAEEARAFSRAILTEDIEPKGEFERIGYLCIQGHPNRICSGCTSACCEPVYAHPEQEPT